MIASSDAAVESVRDYARRKYALEERKIQRDADQKLREERDRLHAMGYSRSSTPIWRVTAQAYVDGIEAKILAKTDALIEGFVLNDVPLNEEAIKEIYTDVSNLREELIRAIDQSLTHGGATEESTFVYGTLQGVPDPLDFVKCRVIERQKSESMKAKTASNFSYHQHGDNSRININSVDRSTNQVIQSGNQVVFSQLRERIEAQMSGADKTAVLGSLTELEQAQNSPSFFERYTRFAALLASHAEIITPFLPALGDMMKHALGV